MYFIQLPNEALLFSSSPLVSLPTGSPQALRFVFLRKAARAEKLGRVITGRGWRDSLQFLARTAVKPSGEPGQTRTSFYTTPFHFLIRVLVGPLLVVQPHCTVYGRNVFYSAGIEKCNFQFYLEQRRTLRHSYYAQSWSRLACFQGHTLLLQCDFQFYLETSETTVSRHTLRPQLQTTLRTILVKVGMIVFKTTPSLSSFNVGCLGHSSACGSALNGVTCEFHTIRNAVADYTLLFP